MKNLLNISFAFVAMLALASQATATPVGISAPDAGASAVLLGIAGLGLVATRKFLRK